MTLLLLLKSHIIDILLFLLQEGESIGMRTTKSLPVVTNEAKENFTFSA